MSTYKYNPDLTTKDLNDILREHMKEYGEQSAECVKAISGLEKQLADTPNCNKWRDISTAPKDGTRILMFANETYIVYWSDDYKWWVYSGMMGCAPTHWMPLPPIPEGENS